MNRSDRGVDDVGRVELAIDADCKAFPGELVDDVEHAESPAIVGPTLDEVIGPDMVWMLGSKPDARSVIQPEPPLLRLLLGSLQPLPPPDPFDTLGVHRPAFRPQHRRDPAIAITAIAGSEPDDVGGQRLVIGPALRLFALGRTMLAENLAGKPLRDGELRHDTIDATATASGAHGLTPRDKGPVWIVYPRDNHGVLADIRYDMRWVWQLVALHVQ